MTNFILGMLLGSGLVLAIRSIDKTLRLRSIRRRVALEREIEERVAARYAEAAALNGRVRPAHLSPAGPASW